FFFIILRRPPLFTLFPYTTLFRSFSVFRRGEKLGEARLSVPGRHNVQNAVGVVALATELAIPFEKIAAALAKFRHARRRDNPHGDRKSTRLNSSHLGISYAVFCLK